MGKLNFSWLIENEVAGHAEPTGSDDLSWLLGNGIRALVRMSDEPKVSPGQIKALGIDDMFEPIPDLSAPSEAQLARMVDFIMESVWKGKPVGVSCRAGIGRTGTVLACYLAKRTHTAQGLVIEVRRKRPGAVETAEQLKTVDQYLRGILNGAVIKNDKNGVPEPRFSATDVPPKGNPQSSPSTEANKPSLADLMKKYSMQPKTAAPTENTLNHLKKIAAERDYGRGEVHANIVRSLSLSLYKQIVDLSLFPKVSRGELLLESASYLHDFGYPPENGHHINGFNLLRKRLVEPDTYELLTESERAIVLYCVLWHRGDDFNIRPEEVQIEPDKLITAMQLASMIRIGDGLCYPSGEPTKKVTVQLQNHALIINACPSRIGDNLLTQVKKANNEKRNLLKELLIGKAPHEITNIEVRKCAHPDC
jgi:atypical dual specificity phosphatase